MNGVNLIHTELIKQGHLIIMCFSGGAKTCHIL